MWLLILKNGVVNRDSSCTTVPRRRITIVNLDSSCKKKTSQLWILTVLVRQYSSMKTKSRTKLSVLQEWSIERPLIVTVASTDNSYYSYYESLSAIFCWFVSKSQNHLLLIGFFARSKMSVMIENIDIRVSLWSCLTQVAVADRCVLDDLICEAPCAFVKLLQMTCNPINFKIRSSWSIDLASVAIGQVHFWITLNIDLSIA